MDALFSPCVKRQLAVRKLFGGIWQEKNWPGSTGKTTGRTVFTTTTTTGPGTCGGTSTGGTTTPTIPKSGSFGQITDGSYADKLTMQYYYNQYPNAINDLQITQICNDDNSMNGGFKFSSSDCVMTACAKVASEKLGRDVSLKEINYLIKIRMAILNFMK